MPVKSIQNKSGTTLLLEGVIGAEDTDEIVACIKGSPSVSVDLSACEHLHTALLQALLVLKPDITALPDDPFWSRCISISPKENKNEDNIAG